MRRPRASREVSPSGVVGAAVECLGRTFAGEAERHAYFCELLRERLKDPEFRGRPGFPAGSDDEIVRMSDPPYYTACPNPFIGEFIAAWRSAAGGEYHRDPFVADVAEGKNHPIYNAHSYHTKVPHLAIQRYIEHYTAPGDLVLDCFCGTGQTGVAAAELDEPRRAVLCDLSPAASLIAYNYCTSGRAPGREEGFAGLLAGVAAELAWMYATRHTGWPSSDRRVRRTADENPGDSSAVGTVQFVLWSDVFRCPNCSGRVNYWLAAASEAAAGLAEEFACPGCGVLLTKGRLEREWESRFDEQLAAPIRVARREPVLIQYECDGRIFNKVPDSADVALIARTDEMRIKDWVPTHPLPDGDKTADPRAVGVTHMHLFYTRRNLAVLAAVWRRIRAADPGLRGALQFLFTSTLPWTTRMNRLLVSNFFKKRGGVIGQTLSGTLYVSSVSVETNPLYRFGLRSGSSSHVAAAREVCGSAQSATDLREIPDESVDYVFIDPPFGHNLAYSDLNMLWESWLDIFTARGCEAVVSAAQKKGLAEYEQLMRAAFREVFRVLKPGRWLTVEFHNSQNTVWRAIQQAIGSAGLVVVNVSLLEKTHGTFNQVTAAGAVKKDLAITAYRPSAALERTFTLGRGSEEAAWTFVEEHLSKLPVVRVQGDALGRISERQAHTLFDQMVAFFVQRSTTVPLSATEFYAELERRFVRRDGMYFSTEQVHAYERARAACIGVRPVALAVTDEASAIVWLREQLEARPQTFQELQPRFMREIQGWARHERTVELREMLEQCFLRYDGVGAVPGRICGFLTTLEELRGLTADDPALVAAARERWYVPDPNAQADLELVRERSLLREFAGYVEAKGRWVRQLRTAAVRAGFKAAYDAREYAKIVAVAAKLPDSVLHEDETLLMYFDVARLRLGE